MKHFFLFYNLVSYTLKLWT